MEIWKFLNGNVAFVDADGNYERVIQQTGVHIEKTLDEIGLIIHQVGYPDLYIKTADVTSTQVLPAAAIAFTGDTIDLFALLSNDFFVLPTGTGTAAGVSYDNTGTDLAATTVQAAITELATEWTITEVDIPSGVAATSGILGMGTVPIELLPAAGAGNYYLIDIIALESTGADYTLAANLLLSCDPYGNGLAEITNFLLTDGVNQVSFISAGDFTQALPLNQSLILSTVGNVDPTAGVGTLKVKIKYKTVIFG